MSKRFIFTLVLMALALFGLSACTPCDMVSPDLVSPDWWDILDPNAAVLNWDYSDSCPIDNFEIILAKDSSFTVIEESGMVSGSTTSWTPPSLDNAEEYFWRVRAVDEGVNGPWSTELRSFFTGPICSAGDLVFPPSLIYPPAGGFFDRSSDSLEWVWQINSCIPESYRIEVSMASDFSDTTYNGATGNPSTRWGFGSTPPAATIFYWRVSAFSDGVWGSPSAIYTFSTDPACPAAGLLDAVAETPMDDDILNTLTPEFTWSYPDSSCTPEGFHFQSSESSDFSTIFIDADNPTSANQSFAAGYPYNDCQEYYWRVAVVSGGVETAFTTPRRFVINETGICDCDPAALPVPVLIWPEPVWTGNYDIVPLNPALEWMNPGPCTPDGYHVKLSDLPDNADPSLNGDISDGLITTYTPPVPLLPAHQYWWHVYSTYMGSLSGNSNFGSFFTEPECSSAAELMPPDLILPNNGSSIDTLEPMLHYEQSISGCVPDTYLINLQTDENFSGVNLIGQIGFPSTGTGPGIPLVDCTWYYWKVAGVQDGTPGPYSEVFSFFTDESGTCSPPGVPGTAKSNNFCRKGTFELFEADWTHVVGDRVLAIARNPLSTYLLLNILDQETGQPFEHEIHCWSYLGNFEMIGPIDGLEVKLPPPTPTPDPEEPLVCHAKLDAEDCKAAGGVYATITKTCQCTQ